MECRHSGMPAWIASEMRHIKLRVRKGVSSAAEHVAATSSRATRSVSSMINVTSNYKVRVECRYSSMRAWIAGVGKRCRQQANTGRGRDRGPRAQSLSLFKIRINTIKSSLASRI